MLKSILILCHGFGFTPSYWNNIQPYFQDYTIINLDLGYFGSPSSPLQLTQNEQQIFAIGHSIGWTKLENLNINFKASVGIQAFRNFIGYQPALRQQRELGLEKLEQMMATNPKSCLRYFYQRCGLSNLWNPRITTNLELLQQDLQALRAESKLTGKHPKLIIGSKQDPIVPPELIYDNFDKLSLVNYILLPEGSHDLGFNHSEVVAPIIRDFFNANQQN